MARRSYEFEVEGVRYQATTFSGKKGMNCVTRLMKLVGPSIGKALKSYNADDSTVESESLGLAAQSLISNLDSNTVVELIDDLLESLEAWTDKDGKSVKVKADFDNYFAGEYGILFQCLFNVIKENYSSFFGGSVSNLLKFIPRD